MSGSTIAQWIFNHHEALEKRIKGVNQLFNTTRNLVALEQLVICKSSRPFFVAGAYNPTISAVWRKSSLATRD